MTQSTGIASLSIVGLEEVLLDLLILHFEIGLLVFAVFLVFF